jgi:hypothetical protein
MSILRYGEAATERELYDVAKGDEKRMEVLKKRRARSVSRSRLITCPSCLVDGHANRDKADICNYCLRTLWKAEDASKLTDEGNPYVIPVRTPRAEHHLPYPHLAARKYKPSDEAVFQKPSSWGDERPEESAGRIMQKLFNEIFEAMSEAYPVPATMEQGAAQFLGTTYTGDIFAMVPRKMLASLLQLWAFITWDSAAAYEQGFSDGSDLIRGMLNGNLTADAFAEEVGKRTARQREAIARAEEGRGHHRS